MTQISEDEIVGIIGSRIQELKDSGFKISRVPFFADESNRNLNLSNENYQELEKHYVGIIQNNVRVTKDLLNFLDQVDAMKFSDKTRNKIVQLDEQKLYKELFNLVNNNVPLKQQNFRPQMINKQQNFLEQNQMEPNNNIPQQRQQNFGLNNPNNQNNNVQPKAQNFVGPNQIRQNNNPLQQHQQNFGLNNPNNQNNNVQPKVQNFFGFGKKVKDDTDVTVRNLNLKI